METTLSPQERRAVQKALLAWYRAEGRDLPWRQTRDPYRILVSEVMLQQTQVERVLTKYAQWLDRFPTLEALAAAPTADVIRVWAPLGYNSRAVRLQRIAQEAIDLFGGLLPQSVDDLLKLHGIGPYTAGAIACFAHRQQTAFWDTNVSRVLTRVFRGCAPIPARAEMQALADLALPAGEAYDWHQGLMDLGAGICVSRSPRCEGCPLAAHCRARPDFLSGAGRELRLVERKAPYTTQPFEQSNRYFRGRIVDLLRKRASLTRSQILALLNKDEEDDAWLEALLEGLRRDGLAQFSEQQVSLP